MLKNEFKEVVSKSNKSEFRKFGYTVGIFLVVVSALLFWKEINSANIFFFSGVFLILSGLIIPVILKPVYIVWMSFAVIMGFVMTRVILTLTYALIFSPMGIIIRILNKDPLDKKIDPLVKTYWIPRTQSTYDPSSSEKQF